MNLVRLQVALVSSHLFGVLVGHGHEPADVAAHITGLTDAVRAGQDPEAGDEYNDAILASFLNFYGGMVCNGGRLVLAAAADYGVYWQLFVEHLTEK